MDAKKCDCCGKLYEHYGIRYTDIIHVDSTAVRIYGLGNVNSVTLEGKNDSVHFDLCPDCMMTILKMLAHVKGGYSIKEKENICEALIRDVCAYYGRLSPDAPEEACTDCPYSGSLFCTEAYSDWSDITAAKAMRTIEETRTERSRFADMAGAGEEYMFDECHTLTDAMAEIARKVSVIAEMEQELTDDMKLGYVKQDAE